MLLRIRRSRRIIDIPIVQIRPSRTQARRNYNRENLKELALSIQNHGILQPLMVRKVSPIEYELIAGERRLRAGAMCGMKKVPCLVITCTDQQAGLYSLAENMQRTDLNFFEEAQGITSVMGVGHLSQNETAFQLGKQQAAIINKLDVLALTEEEKDLMIKGHLTERHAKALLKVKDRIERRYLLSEVLENSLNVSQTEQYVDTYLKKTSYEKRQHQRRKAVIKDMRIFENTIKKVIETMSAVGLPVMAMRSENEDCIEYVVRVPKHSSRSDHLIA